MKLLARVHTRLGDFWWYTALQFTAARCGDFINAFIGLWLVPKYVGMDELGAVLPLANFAVFLALPVGVFSTAFAKYVNVLVMQGEWGKLKTMLRSVFVAAGVFLVFAFLAVQFMLPLVLERVRVAKGTLGVVIVVSALVGAVAPIYLNTLQVMKRFKEVTVINFFCSPLRLVVMLVTMPFRALTGYFVGQAAGPFFQIGASVYALRKEMGTSVKAEPYWTKLVICAFMKYMFFIALAMFVVSLVSFVEPLIIRQRLPEVDSAAFYMISRFAEIGSYLGLTLSTILFPYVSEASEAGGSGNKIIIRSMAGAITFGVVCAGGFYLFGRDAFSFLPNGATYAQYVPELVVLTLVLSVNISVGCFTTGEIAANRFAWLWWFVPVYLLYTVFLFVVTGYGYLQGILPDSMIDALASLNACRLRFVLGTMVVFAVVRLLFAIGHLRLHPRGSMHPMGPTLNGKIGGLNELRT